MTATLPPGATEATRLFWEAAAEQRLVRPVCDQCGASFFVPQIACPRCHSQLWSYIDSSGRGTVTTFTVVHRAPTGRHDAPYVVAVIELDEGWHMMSNIVGCEPEAVQIGQRVEVEFRRGRDGVVLPVFHPVARGRP